MEPCSPLRTLHFSLEQDAFTKCFPVNFLVGADRSRCRAVSRVFVYSVCWELLGSLRNPRRQRQRERHQRKKI